MQTSARKQLSKVRNVLFCTKNIPKIALFSFVLLSSGSGGEVGLLFVQDHSGYPLIVMISCKDKIFTSETSEATWIIVDQTHLCLSHFHQLDRKARVSVGLNTVILDYVVCNLCCS